MTVDSLDLHARRHRALSIARQNGAPKASDALAALVYGTPAQGGVGAAGCLAGVPAQRLASTSPTVHDLWRVNAPVISGLTGRIRWARAGHWLFGAIEAPGWDDRHPCPPDQLANETEALYRELLAFLPDSGMPHFLRLWNYLPHINREDGGLERYRHFNLGRQRALLQARSAAFEGAPAACALGTHEGPLCVRFLAGTAPALAIENPRQVSAYHYPADYGPASPSFSRAALTDVGDGQLALWISGTASVVGHATAHVGDWRAQLEETLRNLQAVVEVARERCTAHFTLAESHCVIYVREAELAESVQAAFAQMIGPLSTAAQTAVILHADVCRSDLLLEIEAHAIAPGQWRHTVLKDSG